MACSCSAIFSCGGSLERTLSVRRFTFWISTRYYLLVSVLAEKQDYFLTVIKEKLCTNCNIYYIDSMNLHKQKQMLSQTTGRRFPGLYDAGRYRRRVFCQWSRGFSYIVWPSQAHAVSRRDCDDYFWMAGLWIPAGLLIVAIYKLGDRKVSGWYCALIGGLISRVVSGAVTTIDYLLGSLMGLSVAVMVLIPLLKERLLTTPEENKNFINIKEEKPFPDHINRIIFSDLSVAGDSFFSVITGYAISGVVSSNVCSGQ